TVGDPRPRRRRAPARGAVPSLSRLARAARPGRRVARAAARDRARAAALLQRRLALALRHERPLGERALPGLRLRAAGAALAPAVRARPEQLQRLLRVR